MLRLAVLLHRSRSPEMLPEVQLRAAERSLRIALPEAWLASHPLTRTDLDTERKHLAEMNLRLQVVAA